MGLIQGIAHINLTIPPSTLPAAHAFYGTTLGLTSVPVPKLFEGTLAWFDIIPRGQQIHISFGEKVDPKSRNHPCFKLGGREELEALKVRIWEHFQRESPAGEEGEGVLGRPMDADRPGGDASGSKGIEFPTRFFARDFAGNRLEFSL